MVTFIVQKGMFLHQNSMLCCMLEIMNSATQELGEIYYVTSHSQLVRLSSMNLVHN